MGAFCNAKFVLEGELKAKREVLLKFKMIEKHSYQCISLNQKSSLVNNELVYNWETYKNKCLNFLEENDDLKKSKVIDEFLKFYNETQYNFIFYRNKMLSLYKEWKKIA